MSRRHHRRRPCQSLKVAADFEHTKPRADTALAFVHRTLTGRRPLLGEQPQNRAEDVEATFRVPGKAPDIWHPDTGVIEPASYRIANGRTTVPLHLEANDAVFVVFRKAATTPSRTVPERVETALGSLEGPWQVGFQPDRGAPASDHARQTVFVE